MDDIKAYVRCNFTLKIGDLILTGTQSGVGPVCINDRLQGDLFEEQVFDLKVK